MMMRLASMIAALGIASVPTYPAFGQDAEGLGSWITLGTSAGPVTSTTRSQPANLLLLGGQSYLVDVGDGAAGQIARAGVQTKEIDAIFVSHLHFDHTGGLAAVLGLRFQTNATDPLTIYGPPGTATLVDGILASMVPGVTANYGVAGAAAIDHRAGISIVEMRNGDSVDIDEMQVLVRRNSHYSFAAGSPEAQQFQSLSYRFNLPGRSIVYSGDTGPSAAVEELAQGADLLVVEMMDIPLTISRLVAANPGMPEAVSRNMQSHLSDHHLSATQVGEMADRAQVAAVVVTHFTGWEVGEDGHAQYLRDIAANYDGWFVIADDMDRF